MAISLKDYHLSKKTFINLRWIALLGQLISVLFVEYFLKFNFDFYIYCLIIILIGIITNFYLQLKIRENQLSNFFSTIYLAYDIMQLGCLLFLTGGITNPFIFLIVIPSVFSSKYLNLISTIFLVLLSGIILVIISFNYMELPHPDNTHFHAPDYYLFSIPLSVFIGLLFLVYFGVKFGDEYRIRKEALDKMQSIIAKEHELVSLGGQAAASAHSLGTPLSTISLIAKELKEELGNDEKYKEDINLLVSQSNRCNEILKKLSLNPKADNKFFGKLSLVEYLQEIILSFKEISNKKFILNNFSDKNQIIINRSIEIIFGLRNFIGNANKFAKNNINISISSDEEKTNILIEDDGKGFAPDILSKLGEPYIRSSYKDHNVNSGMGLGIFIAKTLLEKNHANIEFINLKNNKGATVNIFWDNFNLKNI